MDATELNNQFIKENEDMYISSIVNYNDNINTKKSIETTIEKINDTNTKINTDKLKDLIRREITVYFPLNSIDSKDFPMTIDYISEDMYSLFYKNTLIKDTVNNNLENYFIEFFMYGTDYTEIFLPDLKFNPILMYSNQTEDEYLLCLNKCLNINYKNTTLSFDYITNKSITDMAYFKDRVDILRKYIHNYLAINDNPSIYSTLELELSNLNKELVETYLEHRAKYLLKFNELLSLNFNDLQTQIDFLKSKLNS